MNAPLRGRHAAAGLVQDLDGRPVVLLEHDTQWARTLRQTLMSWGVEVFLGAEGVAADEAPLILMSEHAFASHVFRDRLRRARHLLPEADLLVITEAGAPIDGLPDCLLSHGDLADCLRGLGVSFFCEVHA